MNDAFLAELNTLIEKTLKMNYIKPDDIPNIELYMDQVTTFMDKFLEDSKRTDEDKILTKTMINNYTKNELLPPPEKKKYSKEHIILLIFIYYFKNVLSINDIQKLLDPLIKKFYGKDSKGHNLGLDKIYTEFINLQSDQTDNIRLDINNKLTKANSSFPEIDGEDKEFLSLCTFISLLGYDAYLKIKIIEHIIDGYLTQEDKNSEKVPKTEKSK